MFYSDTQSFLNFLRIYKSVRSVFDRAVKLDSPGILSMLNLNMYVLFRTRNLGQHFLDISKKNDVNQPLVSLINDNY
jgi:hypothetical protein